MTEAELGKQMEDHARSEGKRPFLPRIPAPLTPITDNALSVLQCSARDGGVKRFKDLAAITGLAPQAITEAQRVLMSRNFIERSGEKRTSVLHATDEGRAVLRDAGMEPVHV